MLNLNVLKMLLTTCFIILLATPSYPVNYPKQFKTPEELSGRIVFGCPAGEAFHRFVGRVYEIVGDQPPQLLGRILPANYRPFVEALLIPPVDYKYQFEAKDHVNIGIFEFTSTYEDTDLIEIRFIDLAASRLFHEDEYQLLDLGSKLSRFTLSANQNSKLYVVTDVFLSRLTTKRFKKKGGFFTGLLASILSLDASTYTQEGKDQEKFIVTFIMSDARKICKWWEKSNNTNLKGDIPRRGRKYESNRRRRNESNSREVDTQKSGAPAPKTIEDTQRNLPGMKLKSRPHHMPVPCPLPAPRVSDRTRFYPSNPEINERNKELEDLSKDFQVTEEIFQHKKVPVN